MGLQRINIDQQFAEIGVRTTRAGLNIKMPKGQLTIRNVRPQMKIERQAPSFRVNRQKLRSDLNLQAPLEFAKKFRDKGKQTALQAAGTAKNDGNYLANHRVDAKKRVPNLAKSKQMSRLGPKETNIGLMPSTPAEITWNKGSMRINWSRHRVIIDYTGKNTADVSLNPRHSVEVYLRKKPYFRVTVEEAVSNTGKYINSAI